MSLLDEYGNRREQKGREDGWRAGKKEGMKELISSLLDSGESLMKSLKNLECQEVNWRIFLNSYHLTYVSTHKICKVLSYVA